MGGCSLDATAVGVSIFNLLRLCYNQIAMKRKESVPCGSGPDERGSGKTTAILREIAALSEKGEGRQILLVPELNSHLMERRLAAATHNHGARTAEVLTFSRLADRVFSEVGGLAQQMLTPAGQLLTLQEAARRVQGG